MSVLLVFFVPQAQASDTQVERAKTLVIGKVSSNPVKHYAYLKPMADYVVAQMGDLGIEQAKVVLASSDAQMLFFLQNGEVDWVTETLAPAALYQRQGVAEPLLLKWKKGVPDYYSIIVVRADSDILSINDLRGKTIAFEDHGSTSSFYLPAKLLLDAGLTFEKMTDERDRPSGTSTGYLFSGQEINSAAWLYTRRVDAIALNNLDWEKPDHVPRRFRRKFRIILQSEPIPRGFELVRSDLPESIKQRLSTVLLSAADDKQARKPLRAYQKTSQFSALTSQQKQHLLKAQDYINQVQEAL